jgi:hypothetical protein
MRVEWDGCGGFLRLSWSPFIFAGAFANLGGDACRYGCGRDQLTISIQMIVASSDPFIHRVLRRSSLGNSRKSFAMITDSYNREQESGLKKGMRLEWPSG